MNMKMDQNSLIVAVDGGGSTCRARIVDCGGRVWGQATGGRANIATDQENARRSIAEVIGRAYYNAGLTTGRTKRDILSLALAGAKSCILTDPFHEIFDFRHVTINSDLEAAVVGALGVNDGIVASVGTGSFFVSQRDRKRKRVGGRGFLLADDCSGAIIGRQLFRHVVKVFDGLEESSPLAEVVLERFAGEICEMVSFSLKASPGDLGAFAPDIISAYQLDDPLARQILATETDKLSRILEFLQAEEIGRICLIGGLGEVYRKLLSPSLAKLCVAPIGDALDGAVVLAENELKEVG